MGAKLTSPTDNSATVAEEASEHPSTSEEHQERRDAERNPFLSFNVFFHLRCPVCDNLVRCDLIDDHLTSCLAKPRLQFNEEQLEEGKADECVICLEEFARGDVIARLPCLCVFHKHCFVAWAKFKDCCPTHPD